MALTRIAPGLHGLSLGIVNIFLIEDGGDLCLVDAGLPGSEGKILPAIAKLGRSARDLRHVILTHAHPHHVGSAAAIVEATGAATWMHPLDAPIAEGREPPRPITPAPDLFNRAMYFFLSHAKQTPPRPFAVDHSLADGDEVPFAGGLRAIHVPGHAAGQIALMWPRRQALFATDVCTHMFGLSAPLGYEDRAEGECSQRRVAGLDFQIACFGHGRPIKRNASARFRSKWQPGPCIGKCFLTGDRR